MDLSLMYFLQGLSSTILISSSVIIASKIFSKYFKFKDKEMLYVGLSQIGIISPWLPDAINFILIVFMSSTLSVSQIFLIGYVFIPFYLGCWLNAFIDFYFPEKKKELKWALLIITSIAQISFITVLITDPKLFGYHHGPFQIYFNLAFSLYFLGLIIIVVSTGILFALKALKSDNPKLRLKAKILILAFISWGLGSVIESAFYLTPATVLITKSILISSEIEFYLGYIGIKI
jgi:MFS family permease